jgi:HK97 family phage portal protein
MPKSLHLVEVYCQILKELFMLQTIKSLFNKFNHSYVEQKKYTPSQMIIDYLSNPSWMNRDYKVFAEEGYIKNVIVNRCVTLIAQSAASVPWKLFKIHGETKVEIKNHPLIDLLNRPNINQAGAEFFENLYAYKMISGNAYIQIIKLNNTASSELHLLRPDRVKVVSKEGVIGYEYQTSPKIFFPKNRLTGECDILHLKNFNPLDDLYGLSQMDPASFSIDQHNEASKWNQAMLQNGARPSGALILKNDELRGGSHLSDQEFTRIKEQIEIAYSSPTNAGRPLLLEGGLEWKEMSLSPRDMDFLDAKNMAAREVALAFGVPPQLLGIAGDTTYNNLQEARLSLWEETIIPILDHMTDALNNWLIPMFGRDLKISYDIENISGLAERREKIWARLEKASFMTINEKRAMLGLSPIKNADTL